MGVTWTGPSMDSLIDKMTEKIRRSAETAMQDAIDMGLDAIQRMISSRPRPTSKGSGRIDTGKLLASIAGKVYWEGDILRGELYHSDGGELYYILQIGTGIGGGDANAGGFRHWRSGEYIESSFAARDAAVVAYEAFLTNLEASL